VTERVIGLLRHGEAAGGSRFRGRRDDPLTARGWEQMFAAVENSDAWDAIVTSPLSRCSAFGERLSAERGIPLRVDADLRELDFGRWEGRSAAAIMLTDAAALKAFWDDPYANPPPGGETLQAFERRVLSAWENLAAQRQRNVLLVTHAGVIRMLLRHLYAAPPRQLLLFDVPHASLHQITAAPNGAWRVSGPSAEANE
jgi:alpha-ribazole phosphatase